MATSALANKGETTAERFPTCSHRKSGSRWNGSTQPFQKSWEMSIKTGFDHVMETPYQIKKKGNQIWDPNRTAAASKESSKVHFSMIFKNINAALVASLRRISGIFMSEGEKSQSPHHHSSENNQHLLIADAHKGLYLLTRLPVCGGGGGGGGGGWLQTHQGVPI